MPGLHSLLLPHDRFLPLPDHGAAASAARRVGVEVEFAGLGVAQAADVIARGYGGRRAEEDAREITLNDTALGDVRVELDIALKQHWAEDLAAQLLGDLIPVEVVTQPLAQSDLPRVERLIKTLVASGAVGTGEKLAYGFGIHFNVELSADDGAALVATTRAYALCEDWLRHADPLDPARRILPFVAPFPSGLVAHLAQAKGWGPRDLARAIVVHAPSRHFGLDVLPALQHRCPDALAGVPDDHLKGARPAFHYRLPEARLDEDGWSLSYEWNRWVLIEHVATERDLLAALAEAWAASLAAMTTERRGWAARVEGLIAASDLPRRMGLR
ncbi:MAG: amidoligase family protein [Rhodobacteraceae bacterium]|nr:amidoligase family protein [Paracoccaceae bacterium]